MYKRFLDGLVFGAGFAIAYVIISNISMYLITPVDFKSGKNVAARMSELEVEHHPMELMKELSKPFDTLPLEEKIKEASVIAVARFEPSDDGSMKAIISEILKKTPETTFNYELGQEFTRASYYPRENVRRGDGTVLFFTGSNAIQRYGVWIYDGRIGGLGDMPLDLFRQKVQENAL